MTSNMHERVIKPQSVTSPTCNACLKITCGIYSVKAEDTCWILDGMLL